MNDREKCLPCSGEQKPIKGQELVELTKSLVNWEVRNEHHLEKTYTFKNFKQALKFVNYIGSTAEEMQHHPDIYLTWGKVKVCVYTHKIDGLAKDDFKLADQIDALYISHFG